MFYTVYAAEPLADRLAQWVLHEYGHNPQSIAQLIIFLPSRRAIGTIKQAFLRASDGKAMLMPQLIPIGDINETFVLRLASLNSDELAQLNNLSPEPEPMKRLMAMQSLVWKHGQTMIPRLHNREAALDLAANLLELIDEMDKEQADWDKLDHLVPDDFSQYWQITLEFLKIIRLYWPAYEREQGWGRSWQRRNQLFLILMEAWKRKPPSTPIIAAGTTGSIPAVGRMLNAIHQLPLGTIILPGFDVSIGQEPLSPTHPQAGMQEIISQAGLVPSEIKPLPDFSSLPMAEMTAREALISDAFNLHQPDLQSSLNRGAAIKDLHNLSFASEIDLSLATALLMREMLEQSGKTAACITPDRQLARAVTAQLSRWNIKVDDSAGQPLAQTSQSTFLFIIINAVFNECNPVTLLSIFKHPLCFGGVHKAQLNNAVRRIEKTVIRGMISPTIKKMHTQIKEKMPEEFEIFNRLIQPLQSFMAAFSSLNGLAFVTAVQSVLSIAEFYATDENDECHLWKHEGANELAAFFSQINETLDDTEILPDEFAGILRALMRGKVVRPHYGTHPRLFIMSPMEARLQRFDRAILANLNEGEWPQKPDADPWMNRQMRHKLGLPNADKRMGLQAHDFVQQAAGGEIFMMRTLKSDSAETVPSRFIQRIETHLTQDQNFGHQAQHTVCQWVEQLKNPIPKPSATRPAPKPPLHSRPRELSATSIEKLMQDPYSIYARKILRLKKLDALDEPLGHREFGNLVHDILDEYYTKNCSMQEAADRIFKQKDFGYVAECLWRPRFERIAQWIMQQPLPQKLLSEVKGEWHFKPTTDSQPFLVNAKVDRIEDTLDGIQIIDYKTGAAPSADRMKQGFASQLTIAGAILREGGFGQPLSSKPFKGLFYWKLGGEKIGDPINFAIDKDQSYDDAVNIAHAEIPRIIAAFENPDKAYEALPEFKYAPAYNDFEHLARTKEWME